MDKEAIKKMALEAGRIALFAAITALIAWATEQLAGLDPGSSFYIIGTLLLRLVDKYVHEAQNIDAKGIAPF
ncbi:MAG: hypothetical protein WA991_03995 [Ornithinimicrobium sp.]